MKEDKNKKIYCNFNGKLIILNYNTDLKEKYKNITGVSIIKSCLEKKIGNFEKSKENNQEDDQDNYQDKYYISKNLKPIFVKEKIELFDGDNILILGKVKGGGLVGKIIKTVINAILKVFDTILFNPLLKPIMPIFKVLYAVFILFPLFIIKFIIWSFRFFIWVVVEVVSPKKLVNDFFGTIKMLTFTIVNAVFGFILVMGKKFVNYFGSTVFGGFWGWDKVIMDEWDYKYSEYHNCQKDCRSSKCFRTSSGGLPFSVILGTVICPPIGVFMEYGATGWVNILICILLTLAFYFPGLAYALVCLYC
jgi:uncharacterized membrane protein YqaE (UPF0057 family)